MYAALGHAIVCMMIGLVISLLWDYPLAIGIDKALTCSTKFEWFRAGRHPHKRLAELEKEFYGVETGAFSAEKGPDEMLSNGASNLYTIPNAPIENCNYVAVSHSDVANIGLTVLPNSNEITPHAINHQNGNVVSKETGGYVNVAATNDAGKTNGEPAYETLDEPNTTAF